MKKIFTLMTAFLLLMQFSGCGKKDKHNKHHKKSNTKIVSVEDLQVAFDLMPWDNYIKMLGAMKLQAEEKGSNTHSLLLTVISEKEIKPIKNAKVSLKLVLNENKNETKETKILEGGGMYHYGAVLDLKDIHVIKIEALIEHNNKKYEAKVTMHNH